MDELPNARPDVDDDLEQMQIPLSVRLSGAFHVLGGALTALMGVQSSMAFGFASTAMSVVPWICILAGLSAFVAGTGVSRGRDSSAMLALVLSGCNALGGFGLFVLMMTMGVISLMALTAPVLSTAACGLGIYVLPAIRKISAARKRLEAGGLVMGL